jgi:hypothetical protein
MKVMGMILTVAAGTLLAGCLSGTVKREVEGSKPYIVVEAETTRAIGGVSEVDRKRYFCVSDQGSGFDKRMKPEVYDYLVHELDIHFGRSLGPVKYVASTLPEDPSRPGRATRI